MDLQSLPLSLDISKLDSELLFLESPSKNKNQQLQEKTEKFKTPEKLNGSFWCICSYFNYTHSALKRQNFEVFRDRLKKQNAKLLVIEYSTSEEEHELSQKDADILLQIRGKDILWQKEALINLAVKQLPKDCDKIAWLDSDILFNEDDWIPETAKLLESYKIVQPFSYALFTAKTHSLGDFEKLPSIAADTLIRCSFPKWYWSRCAGLVEHSPPGVPPLMIAPGLAWAARRSVFQEIGLYTGNVLGGGDYIFASAAINKEFCQPLPWTPSGLQKDIDTYANKLAQFTQKSIFFREGAVFHLWHGDPVNRKYKERHKILLEHGFDPKIDTRLAENGLLEWASEKPEMQTKVSDYFWQRKEHL